MYMELFKGLELTLENVSAIERVKGIPQEFHILIEDLRQV